MSLFFKFTLWFAIVFAMPFSIFAQGVDWRLIPDRNTGLVWKVDVHGVVSQIKFKGQEPLGGGLDNWSGLHASPDQTKILYELKNDLWLFDLLTQQHRQLTKVGMPQTSKWASVSAHSLAWSTDSKQIIYNIVSGALEPDGGDEPVWKVIARTADFGFKRLDLNSFMTSKVDLNVKDWDWTPTVLLPKNQMLVVAKGTSRMPLNGELHIFDVSSQTSKQLIRNLAWYGIPRVSKNAEWAVIRAGTRINLNESTDQSTKPNASEKKAVKAGVVNRDDGLRSQLRKVNLTTGESFDITDVGRWAEFNFEDISPSGAKVAYFQRTLAHPNDRRGVIVVNGRTIFASDKFAHPYWINEETLAVIQTGLLKTEEVKIVVLSVEIGTVISEFLITKDATSKK